MLSSGDAVERNVEYCWAEIVKFWTIDKETEGLLKRSRNEKQKQKFHACLAI